MYQKPYRSAEPVICLDEKPVSLHDDVRRAGPHGLVTGQARPRIQRCGTANIFAVVEPKAGRHFNCATPNRSAAQFAQVVQRLVADYPFARKIHLVMDNLNIHCRKSLTDHLGDQQGRYVWSRLHVHYTPRLNQAETELSSVSRQCLGTRRIPKLDLLASNVCS